MSAKESLFALVDPNGAFVSIHCSRSEAEAALLSRNHFDAVLVELPMSAVKEILRDYYGHKYRGQARGTAIVRA